MKLSTSNSKGLHLFCPVHNYADAMPIFIEN